MKPIFTILFKATSLLLCSGLVALLYFYAARQKHDAEKHVAQNLQIIKADTNPHNFSIYTDVIVKFVPALKS